MIHCTGCGELKKPEEFRKDRSNKKTGVTSQCKECLKFFFYINRKKYSVKQKQYYENNKEAIFLKQKEYYLSHKKYWSDYFKRKSNKNI